MPGLLLRRSEQKPPTDPPLRGVEVLTNPEALLERLRAGPGRVPWVALAADVADPFELARQVRDADPTVGIALLQADTASPHELVSAVGPLEPGRDDVARIAHAMGTPLNTILGYAEMLEQSCGDEKGRKRAATIIDQVHRLSALVEKLLKRGA